MWGLSGPSMIISGDETVVVERDNQVTYFGGKPVHREPERFDLTCNVQPVTGMTLLLMPEGDRFKETYWVYTNELAQPLRINDRIVRQGVNFQVQKVETWGQAPNGYQRALIQRIDVGPKTSPVEPLA